ncbi:EF-hand domain-containing family member C2 [Ambystoma mexicanum]|uniref:EF-hand domain-containing family member C2 n=1 Tax=Ambystoma mexicanum TaxID=8296 RepID=UPI0037E75A53
MALPLLPGNSFNRNLGKEKFHKSQHFGYCNKVAMIDAEKPGIGGEPLLGQNLKPKYSVFPRGIGSDAPSWVAFDKQVLSFDAYFQEVITERREETYRIRQCKIYFYLEDDTIQVVEPQVKNSGIPQGTIVRRHRIPLPPPYDEEYYKVDHFNINKEVVFYATPYKIINCDQFTRNFLTKLGVRLNPPGCVPEDAYSTMRKREQDAMKPLRPYDRFDTLKQFLEHDRHVLRFYCIWDDTSSMYGDLRDLILHYYLADDTVEILEVIPKNAGRDAVPVFLHRGKLPKYGPLKLHRPGEIAARTVLNVFGPMGHGGRYLIDNLKTGAVHHEIYKDCDLAIGATINLLGRKIILCDCDPYTKEFYKTKYGIEDFTPLQCRPPPPPRVERKFPPYTGFGSEEDSLCSCLSVVPKPPQKDFRKFMEKDRRGLESNVLRFAAKLVTDNPIDKERTFIISFFLSDDTILVYEPPQRNSGVLGGKFLERSQVRKPGQEIFKSEMSEYFKAQDLFVGAKVLFNCHHFMLVDADDYAFTYMEKNSDEFPVADISSIIIKLREAGASKSREIKQLFAGSDPGNTNVIAYDQFRNLITRISDGNLCEHEIMTLGRNYGVRDTGEVDLNVLLAVAQEQLKRKAFENFSKLTDVFMYNDREKNGLLPAQEVRTIFKAFRVPLEDDLLRTLISRFEGEHGQVCYQKLTSGLNWREKCPAVCQTPIQHDEDWSGKPSTHIVKQVSYLLLLEDLFGLQD